MTVYVENQDSKFGISSGLEHQTLTSKERRKIKRRTSLINTTSLLNYYVSSHLFYPSLIPPPLLLYTLYFPSLIVICFLILTDILCFLFLFFFPSPSLPYVFFFHCLFQFYSTHFIISGFTPHLLHCPIFLSHLLASLSLISFHPLYYFFSFSQLPPLLS